MIKLDRWESQFVWFSKGWLSKKDDLSDMQILKNIWATRCGLKSEHVKSKSILHGLISLIVKLNYFNNSFQQSNSIETLLEALAPQGKWDNNIRYTDNIGYAENGCIQIVRQFLSLLQINDNNNVLIDLQPFEPEMMYKAEYDIE